MCGVVGLIGTQDAAKEAFLGLTTLQHRGQDAAGILTYDDAGFHRVKNLGLIESAIQKEHIESLTGDMGIAHARYATSGRGDLGEVQPFLLSYPFGIGMVHNGNIVNGAELGEKLKRERRRHLLTRSDTEVILNLFADGLARHLPESAEQPTSSAIFEALTKSCSELFKVVNGSFSIVTLVADQGVVAFRDPYGIRPLIWGTKRGGTLPTGEAHMIASESVALSFLGYEVVRDLRPGELVFIDRSGRVHSRVFEAKELRPCMFEWVYFASPESQLDRVPVYGARIQLGKNLARTILPLMQKGEITPDIIVPVPESSRIAAIALSEELGVPYREVLIKNRYIKRTFILDTQEKRKSAVSLKLSPVRSEIQGKRVMLVDDSIVRGTTSKKIVELVRAAGATRVYFVSTCPPIKKPCYYGIDFPVEGELIAAGKSQAEIEKYLGADAVIYQGMEGLERAIAPSGQFKPCMACLDGCYPTDISRSGSGFSTDREKDRKTFRGSSISL